MLSTTMAVVGAMLPTALPAWASYQHDQLVNSAEYKQTHGHWQVVNLPSELNSNAMHLALLPTGKVLMVAGSGNNQDNFNAFQAGKIDVLKTVVLDPVTLEAKLVPTPADLFCAGHATLAKGNLLVAGGTSGYELLDGKVTKPAGPMLIHNENPDDKPRVIKKGTKFTSKTGKVYVSVQEVTIQPAEKIDYGEGKVKITHSTQTVFVEAEQVDNSYLTKDLEQYEIEGLTGADAENIYGQGGPMTLEKQDFRGIDDSYEFNPWTEQYERVGSMQYARWYPTLAQLPPAQTGSSILAVSGLDNTGEIIQGLNEVYNPQTKTWSAGPEQYFPTYPALVLMGSGELFYSGSNAGYGPEDKGREPGIWDIPTNTFRKVPGLRQQNMLETSATVLLPPTKGQNEVQSQRVMVLGGGEIGDKDGSTSRTDIIDLTWPEPRFVPGPDLPAATRYPIVVNLPNDEVLVTGGSEKYRGRGNSDHHHARLYDPTTNSFKVVADEVVGRNYHSGGLLLPDGRVLVFGSDPLFADKDNTQPGTFEHRLEIFSPPYLFQGKRPSLDEGPTELKLGGKATFKSGDADRIQTARLIPPSSTTHVTNVEQRSIAMTVTHRQGAVELGIPENPNLLLPGWYMLFVADESGTPSAARWVQVS